MTGLLQLVVPLVVDVVLVELEIEVCKALAIFRKGKE